MKFKLVEKFDETRSVVQEYMYDAMDELNNASLEEYIQWFKDNLTAYPEDIEQAVTDAYIEACDYGMIKGIEKTRITSELKEYIESHTDIIDDTYELMRQCPKHLQHELKIVLSKLDESLTEAVLEEALRPDLKRFIEQHAELLDENNIEELYKQCPRELKIPLVRTLKAASLGDNTDIIKRATYLEDFYDDDELINLVLSVGEHVNDVFDAFDYIMNNWDEFFDDDMLNESLNEELLTEGKTKLGLAPEIQRSLKQAMYDVVSHNKTDVSSHKAQTSLLKYLCVNNGITNPKGYCVHHFDCNHNNYAAENVCLVKTSVHNSVHNELVSMCIQKLLEAKQVHLRDDLLELTMEDFTLQDIHQLADLFIEAQAEYLDKLREDKTFPKI